MRVEAVVSDLDGTLVDADYRVSTPTSHAIALIGRAGIRLVIATARTPAGLDHVPEVTAVADFAVCCSGTIGWAVRERSHVWREPLDLKTVRAVIDLAMSSGAAVAGYDGAVWRMTEEYARLSPGQPRGPRRVQSDPHEIGSHVSLAMAIRLADGDPAEVLARLPTGARAACSRAGRATVIDVTPAGVDKGTGALRALHVLGVDPVHAIGFGDMPNDVPMLAVMGRSFAVGGDQPCVVRASDEVLAPVHEDGFARKIASIAASGWRL